MVAQVGSKWHQTAFPFILGAQLIPTAVFAQDYPGSTSTSRLSQPQPWLVELKLLFGGLVSSFVLAFLMIADGVSGVLLASLEGSPYHRLWSLGSSHLALEDRTLVPCCSLCRGWKLFPAFQLWFSLRNVGFSQDALLCFSFKLQNSFLGPRVLCYALGLFCLFFKIVPLRFFFLFFFPLPAPCFSWCLLDLWHLTSCFVWISHAWCQQR